MSSTASRTARRWLSIVFAQSFGTVSVIVDDMDDERQTVSENATPRWVKAFIAIALLVVALVVVLLVFGGGGHGPSRHGLPAFWVA